MKKYIDDFKENIEGLRDFVELISQFLEQNADESLADHLDQLLPIVTAYKLINNGDDITKKETEDMLAVLKDKFDITLDEIKEEKDSNRDYEILVTNERVSIKSDKSVVFSAGTKSLASINTALEKFKYSEKQKERLYGSSLMSLLSSVDWFLSQILHFYFDKYPDAGNIEKKTLTFEQMKAFDSIRDAENFLIDEKIEQILRGSFKDWIDFLKGGLKLGLGYMDDFEHSLTEIFQRRNILVHNGGIVNSIYLSKVHESLKKGLKIGNLIRVSDDYLEDAIDKFHLVFSLIACELWKKTEPDNPDRGGLLLDLSYFYLVKQNYKASYTASKFLLNDKKTSIAHRTSAELNYWCAKKNAGEEKEIDKDLKNADYSDKALLYQVALFALRDEKEFFFANIGQVMSNQDISPKQLYAFPVFESMRNTKEFKEFCQKDPLVKKYTDDLALESML